MWDEGRALPELEKQTVAKTPIWQSLGETAAPPPHPRLSPDPPQERGAVALQGFGPEGTHAVSSPQARWRWRRCSAHGEKLQRSGLGPSCRSSCSMSVGAATYTVRTFPKLANHTGPKRAAPCTWENGAATPETWARGLPAWPVPTPSG